MINKLEQLKSEIERISYEDKENGFTRDRMFESKKLINDIILDVQKLEKEPTYWDKQRCEYAIYLSKEKGNTFSDSVRKSTSFINEIKNQK